MEIRVPETRLLGKVILDECNQRMQKDDNYQEIKGEDGKPIPAIDKMTQLPIFDVTTLVKQDGGKRYETINVKIVSKSDPAKGLDSMTPVEFDGFIAHNPTERTNMRPWYTANGVRPIGGKA